MTTQTVSATRSANPVAPGGWWLITARGVQGTGASETFAKELFTTDVVAERGDDGVEKVRDLTGGDGTHVVLEAVGLMPAYEQALGVVRPGGVISRVGVPQTPQGYREMDTRKVLKVLVRP